MEKSLHLFNGDASYNSFITQNIPGATAVWREMLVEGPVFMEVGAGKFWAARSRFFQEEYGIASAEYRDQTIDEFGKIQDFGKYEEVILWFEYDLFCQVNLLALLSFFAGSDSPGVIFSLICVGRQPGHDRLTGLSELPPAQYPALWENRQSLTREDLQFARRLWKTYCSDDHAALPAMARERAATFPYLAPALEAHLRRFPEKKNGLNALETALLQLVKAGYGNRRQLISAALSNQGWYGFGDLQYEKYLDHLRPLLQQSNGKFELNDLGIKVLEGEADFEAHATHTSFFGGCRNWDHRF